MKQEIKQILIKHLSGGKANQIDEFDYQANPSISFGRAMENDLHFDSDQDVAVSRSHGSIAKGETPGTFVITDNDSLNGTFINGEKINGTRPLRPGDEVTLGLNGPKFVFDTHPSLVSTAATQLINVPNTVATREMAVAEKEKPPVVTPKADGIGKQTFERAIVSERKRSQRTLISVLGASVLILAALGYTFRDSLIPAAPEVVMPEMPEIESTLNAQQIAADNMDKVVFIEFGYKLIHTETGDDVYHQYSRQKDKKTGQEYLVPLYIEVEPGVVEPLLGLKKNVTDGAPIAISGATGSGFIVDEKGFILTNRHVAANWNAYYTFPNGEGYLYQMVNGQWKITGTTKPPYRWVPSESRFFGQKPLSGKILEGVVTYMDVTFAKTDLRTPAKIVRVSNTHDVAMIKIDLPGNLSPVVLNTEENSVAQGQKIAVMGYPGLSPEVAVAKISQDFANRKTQYLSVPDPTITDGTIGKIIRGTNPTNDVQVGGYFSMLGDYYQLTASETGAGNSGGPVFDKDGKVIGIFSASQTSQEGARITFAIPISYGLELMHSQRVIR